MACWKDCKEGVQKLIEICHFSEQRQLKGDQVIAMPHWSPHSTTGDIHLGVSVGSEWPPWEGARPLSFAAPCPRYPSTHHVLGLAKLSSPPSSPGRPPHLKHHAPSRLLFPAPGCLLAHGAPCPKAHCSSHPTNVLLPSSPPEPAKYQLSFQVSSPKPLACP